MQLEDKKFKLWYLAWPIFIELFLQLLLGAVDTLMVSKISDDAVAVVGVSNQLFMALMTLFIVVAGGAGILMAQRIGARKQDEARIIAIMAVKYSFVIGIGISVILYLMPIPIVKLLHLPPQLFPLAKTYISIVGGGMILAVVMTSFTTIIRNTGNTRATMITSIGMNVIHLFFNYCFIFGAFGFPQWGLTGVAISTVFSRLCATVVLFFVFRSSFELKIRLADFKLFDKKLFLDVLRIGWPMGVNAACWFGSQLMIISFIGLIGVKELAARTYMNTLESFCFMLGYAIALSVQIQIAHLFGAGRLKEAYAASYRALGVGVLLVSINALLLYFFGVPILHIFTHDPAIIHLTNTLFILNLALQPAKMMNMALNNSLNAVGDTRFSMVNSLFSMWLVATLGSYLVGVHWGYGLIGVYCCMIADEYVRGFIALFRWRRKKYLKLAEQKAEAKTRIAKPIGQISEQL